MDFMDYITFTNKEHKVKIVCVCVCVCVCALCVCVCVCVCAQPLLVLASNYILYNIFSIKTKLSLLGLIETWIMLHRVFPNIILTTKD